MDSKAPSIPSATPASTTPERSYEDFHPTAKWVLEEAKTLEVNLPDFKKEEIKIQLDKHGNMRVSGERPLEGNKWSRFRINFHIPKDCNFNDIQARFTNSVLAIILPKKVARNSVLLNHPTQQQEPPTTEKIVKEEVKNGTSKIVKDDVKKGTSKGRNGGGGAEEKVLGEATAMEKANVKKAELKTKSTLTFGNRKTGNVIVKAAVAVIVVVVVVGACGVHWLRSSLGRVGGSH